MTVQFSCKTTDEVTIDIIEYSGCVSVGESYKDRWSRTYYDDDFLAISFEEFFTSELVHPSYTEQYTYVGGQLSELLRYTQDPAPFAKWSWEYDDSGVLVSYQEEGLTPSERLLYREDILSNEEGLAERVEYDTDGDGVVDLVDVQDWSEGRLAWRGTYSGDGTLLSTMERLYVGSSLDHTELTDEDADGVVDIEIVRTHDGEGRVLQVQGLNAAGTWEEEYRWGEDGELRLHSISPFQELSDEELVASLIEQWQYIPESLLPIEQLVTYEGITQEQEYLYLSQKTTWSWRGCFQ